ncbi:MAG: hypothetical protein WCD45_06005 [Gallionella sp.]
MSRILIGMLCVCFSMLASGEEEQVDVKTHTGNIAPPLALLTSEEPNRLGCTKDSYERACFLDFVLSQRYPLFYDALEQGHKYNMLPFFSFTGRMGQYSGTVRHSSPVVTKQFNPKLYFRFYTSDAEGQILGATDSKQDFYDVGYAHESNGQYVDSVAVFNTTAASVGGAAIAQDYISRGWDFLNYKRHLHFDALGSNSMDIDLRYFLSYGLLQKGSEEYFAWEAPRPITHISQVDGIRLKVNRDVNWSWFKGAALSFTTGYRDPAKWNTLRAELGFTPLSDLMGLPIVLWGQTGYLVNVTQYYRQSWSVGLAASFETYK